MRDHTQDKTLRRCCLRNRLPAPMKAGKRRILKHLAGEWGPVDCPYPGRDLSSGDSRLSCGRMVWMALPYTIVLGAVGLAGVILFLQPSDTTGPML